MRRREFCPWFERWAKRNGLDSEVLIGFLPTYYSLNVHRAGLADDLRGAAIAIDKILESESAAVAAAVRPDVSEIVTILEGKSSLAEISPPDRWKVRQSILRFQHTVSDPSLAPQTRRALTPHRKAFSRAIEYVPLWVVVGVALALGIGTTIGYKRIVVTVAEKIGRTHLTYAQEPPPKWSPPQRSAWQTSSTCRSAQHTCSPRGSPEPCGPIARASKETRSGRSAWPGCLTLPAAILPSGRVVHSRRMGSSAGATSPIRLPLSHAPTGRDRPRNHALPPASSESSPRLLTGKSG